MKKIILCMLMVSSLMMPFQKSQAAAAGAAAIFGGPAGTLAIAGLVVAGGTMGVTSLLALTPRYQGSSQAALVGPWMLGLIVSVVLLDGENNREIKFNEMAHKDLLNLGLSEVEADEYNMNVEELSAVFNTASRTSSVEESAQVWTEAMDMLGQDAVVGFAKIVNTLN